MTDEITITVDREDLQKVIHLAGSFGNIDAVKRVQAAVPEPEWEPSEALVKKTVEAWYGDKASFQYYSSVASTYLKKMHNVGIEFNLTEKSPT